MILIFFLGIYAAITVFFLLIYEASEPLPLWEHLAEVGRCFIWPIAIPIAFVEFIISLFKTKS